MHSGRKEHAEVLVPLTTSLKVRKESRTILIKPSSKQQKYRDHLVYSGRQGTCRHPCPSWHLTSSPQARVKANWKNSLRNNSRVHCRLFGLLSTLPLTVRSIQIRKNVWETFWVDQGTLQRGTWGKCAAHHGYSDPSHCIEPGCKEKKKGNTIIGTCDLFHPGQKYEPIEEKYLADTEPTFNHIIC